MKTRLPKTIESMARTTARVNAMRQLLPGLMGDIDRPAKKGTPLPILKRGAAKHSYSQSVDKIFENNFSTGEPAVEHYKPEATLFPQRTFRKIQLASYNPAIRAAYRSPELKPWTSEIEQDAIEHNERVDDPNNQPWPWCTQFFTEDELHSDIPAEAKSAAYQRWLTARNEGFPEDLR